MKLVIFSEPEAAMPCITLLPHKKKEANLEKSKAQREFVQLLNEVSAVEDAFFEDLFEGNLDYWNAFVNHAIKYKSMLLRVRARGTKFWKLNPDYFETSYAPHPDVPNHYHVMR